MQKFTLICENEYGITAKRMVEFEADSLNDILNEVEMFLRGAGFYFRGTLDIVPYDDEISTQDTDDDSTSITGDDVTINFDYGAAQPALHLFDTVDLSSINIATNKL